MYSVVVLMALSTSADAPDLGRRGGRGCCGCCGGGYSSSCGGYYAGYGGGYYGGCSGWSSAYSGGCSGSGYRSSSSGYYYPGSGMPYAGEGMRGYSSGYYYPSEGVGGYSSGYYSPGEGVPFTGGERAMPYDSAGTSANAATVIVTLPEEGYMGIDDYRSPVFSNRHTYITSPIGTNETRKITFWTEVTRDGKREKVSKEVTVKPGQKTEVNLGAKGDR
jgi:uncharacterized protein (TIGR03000 family)